MQKIRLILLILLGFFIIIDILLFFYLLKRNNILTLDFPFVKKDFKVYDDFYKFDGKLVKVVSSTFNDEVINIAYLKASIKENPYVEEKTGYYILPVNFKLNTYNFTAKIALGFYDSDTIFILKAINGVIPNQQIWDAYSLKDSVGLFMKNGPVIIGIVFQKDLKKLKSLSTCSKECQFWLTKAELLYKQNNYLIRGLEENQRIKNDLIVGPTQNIIIYEE